MVLCHRSQYLTKTIIVDTGLSMRGLVSLIKFETSLIELLYSEACRKSIRFHRFSQLITCNFLNKKINPYRTHPEELFP